MKPLIMTAFDAARLAGELRDTACNLRLCLAELIAEDCSLLADLLWHFPNQIEALANDLAERPSAEFAPAWPAREASPEAHFSVLLARQHWWHGQHSTEK